MAVSNSTDFALTTLDLIVEAREYAGIHESEEPLSAAELVEARKKLNAMLKAWQAGGVSFTFLTEGQITLTQSDADLVFGAGGDFTIVPFEISDVRLTRDSVDRPMIELSRQEYYSLPNKTNEGVPTQWFYDRQRDGGTMYIWPAPDATAGTLKFTYKRKIYDMDANSDDLDLPQEWYEPVVFNLAYRLMLTMGTVNTPLGQEVKGLAVASLQELKDFDTGEGMGVISIVPTQHYRPVSIR